MATNLSRGNATAWAGAAAPMIGNGLALHYTYPADQDVHVLQRHTDENGDCNPIAPTQKETLSLFAWQGGIPTLVACTVAGSASRRYTNPGRRITFNVQFSDGTIWIDKVVQF